MHFLSRYYLFGPLLAIGIADLIIGIIVVLRNKRVVHYVVGLLCFALGLFCLSIGIMSAGFSQELMTLGFKGAAFAGAPIPFLLLMLSKYFPDKKPKMSKIGIMTLLVPFFFFALFSFTNVWLHVEAVINDGIIITIVPFFVTAYLLYYLIYLFWAAIKFYESAKTSSGISKIQIGYLLLGFYLTVAIGMFCNVFMTFIGIGSFVYFGPMASIFLVGFTAVAITKTRLLDISVIISRTVAEILTVLFLGLIYVILVWLYRIFVSTSIDIIFLTWTISFGILVGQTYQHIRLKIQTTSDKFFLRGKYDYYRELADATARITKTLSMTNISDTLQAIFRDVIEVSKPRFYLPEEFEQPEVKNYLAFKEPTFIAGNLIVPCLLEDRLIALFMLGGKLSEDPYTDEDIELLRVLASQTAIAIDHTRTYEEIKKDFEANQKKLYDTERLLARSEKIAALARLIQEYNHEIRTPLSIMGAKLMTLPDDPKEIEDFTEVKKLFKEQIRRGADILETTLRLSEPKERNEVELDLNEVIEEALKLYQPIGVKLVKELGVTPKIKGDFEDLKMVFINLVKNAREAIPESGEIRVKTHSATGDDGPVVFAEVSDTGVGIPPENLERIFEPFFSTHVTKGRGLGLSLTFRIIREHLGRIEVLSKIGFGSTFKIQFPALKKLN